MPPFAAGNSAEESSSGKKPRHNLTTAAAYTDTPLSDDPATLRTRCGELETEVKRLRARLSTRAQAPPSPKPQDSAIFGSAADLAFLEEPFQRSRELSAEGGKAAQDPSGCPPESRTGGSTPATDVAVTSASRVARIVPEKENEEHPLHNLREVSVPVQNTAGAEAGNNLQLLQRVKHFGELRRRRQRKNSIARRRNSMPHNAGSNRDIFVGDNSSVFSVALNSTSSAAANHSIPKAAGVGLLSASTAQHLLRTSKHHATKYFSAAQIVLGFLVFTVIPPVFVALLTCFIPLSPAPDGFSANWVFHGVWLPIVAFFSFGGSIIYAATMMGLRGRKGAARMLFLAAILSASTACAIVTLLGRFVRFPVPFGLPIGSLLGSVVGLIFVSVHAFGLAELRNNRALRRATFMQIVGISMMPVLVLVFSLYRNYFAKLSAANQANFAALWPLLKIIMKKISQFCLVQGLQSDMQVFAAFAFDCASALCVNLLFMASADWRSVAVLIAVDIIENFYYMLRAVSYFSHAKGQRTDFVAEVHSNIIRNLVVAVTPTASPGEITRLSELTGMMDAVQPPLSKTMLVQTVVEDVVYFENAAICAILHMAVAELAEIFTSLWIMICIPIVFWAKNGKHYSFFRGAQYGELTATNRTTMDDIELLTTPMIYSASDALFELVSFVMMGRLLLSYTGMHPVTCLIQYLHSKKLYVAVFSAAIMTIMLAVNQFIVHLGCTLSL